VSSGSISGCVLLDENFLKFNLQLFCYLPAGNGSPSSFVSSVVEEVGFEEFWLVHLVEVLVVLVPTSVYYCFIVKIILYVI